MCIRDRGTPGDRFQRHPGQAIAQEPQGEIVGLRAFGVGVVGHLGGVDAHHLFALAATTVAGGLLQGVFDRAFARMRHAGDGGPVDLAGVVVAQRLGQGAGDAVGARQHQHAGGVLILSLIHI